VCIFWAKKKERISRVIADVNNYVMYAMMYGAVKPLFNMFGGKGLIDVLMGI
jgi:hypothetical protein